MSESSQKYFSLLNWIPVSALRIRQPTDRVLLYTPGNSDLCLTYRTTTADLAKLATDATYFIVLEPPCVMD